MRSVRDVHNRRRVVRQVRGAQRNHYDVKRPRGQRTETEIPLRISGRLHHDTVNAHAIRLLEGHDDVAGDRLLANRIDDLPADPGTIRVHYTRIDPGSAGKSSIWFEIGRGHV